MEKCEDEDKLKQLLRYVFSFKQNIEVFSETFFPDTITNEIPEFHSEVYEFLFAPSNDALAAPRGHAKSSIAGIVYLSFCIVNGLEKYIVYMSQNHRKTIQFVEPIRYEFKNNRILRFVYGDLTPTKAKDEFGRDREDCFDVGGTRVEAVSFEKNIRGFKYKNMRPTLIIADDIDDDQRVLNPELRIKDQNKLNKIVIPSLDIDGRFKYIGTILHFDSTLARKVKLYKGKVFAACDENFNNILWADRFTKEKLMQIQKDIGTIPFQQEYLNNPMDTTISLIKREWIQQCFRPDISSEEINKMEFSNKSLGCDFAFSDRITADDSAYVGLGEKDEFYYLLLCRKEKGLSLKEQMEIIKNELYKKHKYDYIGLEENSIKAISKDIAQWNMPITLFWTAAADPAKKKTDYKDYDYSEKRHTVGKINLINRLGTSFENKRFIIPYKTDKDKQVAHLILSECTSYALADGKLVEAGVHPDIPIGMGYALELLTKKQIHFDFA